MSTLKEWLPIVGGKASFMDADGVYHDVVIDRIIRGGKVVAKYVADNIETTINLDILERPLSVDVNERFQYFEELVSLVLDKKLRSLFVTGEGGIGKSHTINERLKHEGLQDGVEYVKIKGYTTARALYNHLEAHHDKTVIIDDCDSALTNSDSQNILKAVLDTYDRRHVQWLTAKGGGEGFDFNGSVIFLSNKNKDAVAQSLLSRSIVVDLYMSPEEKIERMGYLLPSLDCVKSITIEERIEVLREIDKYKHTVNDLNLRTLIKGLIVYENTRNMDIVKYQILNG